MVSIAFDEPDGQETFARLREFTTLVSSNLSEAEMKAAFAREQRAFDSSIFDEIEWVFPIEPLTSEIDRALQFGYLRGADLWHVAVALYTASEPGELAFVTLDRRQQAVASSLGFQT